MTLQSPDSNCISIRQGNRRGSNQKASTLLVLYCYVDLWLNHLQLPCFLHIYSFTVQHTWYIYYYSTFELIYPSCGQCPLIALTETCLGSSCCDSLLAISVTNPCVYSLLWLKRYRRNFLMSKFLVFMENSTAWKIGCYAWRNCCSRLPIAILRKS